jgi:hypothetical protein
VDDAKVNSLYPLAMLQRQPRRTHVFAGHRQEGPIVITSDRVIFSNLDDQVVKTTRRSNLGDQKGLDSEEADDDCDDESVEVVCEEGCFDAADESVQHHTNG